MDHAWVVKKNSFGPECDGQCSCNNIEICLDGIYGNGTCEPAPTTTFHNESSALKKGYISILLVALFILIFL